MKEKDAQVDFDAHQMTLFVEKEDGSYGPMQTGSYLAKNYVSEFWKIMEHFHSKALDQLIRNEISPVAYYMILREMAPADVAARIGISAALVKKHMKPQHFKSMKIEIAQRYAEIFGIPVANLFQISKQSTSGFIDPSHLQQNNTDNPFVVTIE